MKARRTRARWLTWPAVLLLVVLAAAGWTAWDIERFSHKSASAPADAAIVLGAAVWNDRPSPVLRERVNHAILLYRANRVEKIIFTGGRAAGDSLSEAEAARRYALGQGVPASDLLTETKSRTTYENLANAREIASGKGLRTFLIVSDPLHMRRAMDMANDLHLSCEPSPTTTSAYVSGATRRQFLMRETYYLLEYRWWDRVWGSGAG